MFFHDITCLTRLIVPGVQGAVLAIASSPERGVVGCQQEYRQYILP